MPRKPQTALALSGAAFFLATTPGCPKEEPPVANANKSMRLRPCTIEDVTQFGQSRVVQRRILDVYAPKLPGAPSEPKKEQRAYDSDQDGRPDCEITVDIGLRFDYALERKGETWGSQHSWWELYPTPGGVTKVTWNVWEMDGLILEVSGKIDQGSDGTEDGAFLYSIGGEGIGLKLVYRSKNIPSGDGH